MIEQLKNNLKPQYEIAAEFNISETLLSNINLGLKYKQENVEYPVRKNYKNKEDYEPLIHLLKKSTLTFREIAEKLNIGESTVKKINYGDLCKFLSDEYPIRKVDSRTQKSNRVKELLLTTELTFEEISVSVGCSITTVSRINRGITHRDLKLKYPLRK